MVEVICQRGDTCRFTLQLASGPGGLNRRYDKARFQARNTWDVNTPAIISVDETSGITIDYGNATVTVVIGASLTEKLIVTSARNVPAQLRLYNSADPDDRISWIIRFLLLPAAIDDE